MTKPVVSIIITTKNEERNIENCLQSIKSQTYPLSQIETIVVDNNSSDRTKKIAEKYTQKVFNRGSERSAQRNYGMMMAKGKYLVYLDADMILSPSVIEKAVRKIEKENLAGLYVPEVILGNSYWSRVRRFERSFYDGTVIDCVRIVRKNIFGKVGGFDLSMTGPEDWDFDKKVRNEGKVGVLDQYDFAEIDNKLKKVNFQSSELVGQLSRLSSCALVYHNEAKFNLKKYFQKKSYYAKSFNNYISKWGKDDPDIKKQLSFYYRYFGVFLEKGKWKKFLKHLSLPVGVYFLRLLVGVSFARQVLIKK